MTERTALLIALRLVERRAESRDRLVRIAHDPEERKKFRDLADRDRDAARIIAKLVPSDGAQA